MKTNKDSLQITINDDGSVSFDWDKNDPKWNWLNNLSSEEIQKIVKKEMYGIQKNCHTPLSSAVFSAIIGITFIIL